MTSYSYRYCKRKKRGAMNYNNFAQGPKKRLQLTKEGIDKLKKKLDEITARRITAVKMLRRIDKDNLDEPYISAEIEQLERAEVEAAELTDLLQHVEPAIRPKSPRTVSVGCTVEIKTDSKIVTYTVVCPLELDIKNGKISEDSPLGKAMLGRKKGDLFSITAPKGTVLSYEVVSIR